MAQDKGLETWGPDSPSPSSGEDPSHEAQHLPEGEMKAEN